MDLAVSLLLALVASVPDRPQGASEFAEVRAILQTHCIDCHGAEGAEAGLRADIGMGLLVGGDTGPAVVPGKSDESLLVAVLSGTHKKISRMPLDAEPLDEGHIQTIRRWIDQGAGLPEDEKKLTVHSDHWSFQPIKRPAVPEVQNASWPRNDIDRFILSRCEEHGIAPSPPADRLTLLRRVYLDLIGLPPTVAQVDAFLNDQSADAYEKVVEQLLASVHFGERWGRHWLDAARYADSNGYTIDGPRSIWMYRDWVINAFNNDMPFDQFVVEQLAGDLLPNAGLEQQIATGFHRNTMFNQEGGTDPEQFRVERVVDRVNTTGEVFLGLTLGCAQCHSHKYDPISQRDYFSVFAFFNNSDEPQLPVPTPVQLAKQKQWKTELDQRAKQLSKERSKWLKRLAAQATGWDVLKPVEFSSSGGAQYRVLEDHSVLLTGENPSHDRYTWTSPPISKLPTALRLEVLTDERLPNAGPGRAANGNFVLTELTLRARTSDGTSIELPLESAMADHSQPNHPVGNAIDGKPETGWAINTNGAGPMNVSRTAIFTIKATQLPVGDLTLEVTLDHASISAGYNIGRFRLAVTSQPGPFAILPRDIQEAVQTPKANRTKEQELLLKKFQQSSDEEYARLSKQLQDLKKSIETTMVIRERPEPRKTHVHLRGDFLSPGPEVIPNVPAVLGSLTGPTEGRNRLDFARWLVSRDNPLTARVTVNRIWQHLFGVGIVETENDFGSQGSLPTHPELLDWLASELASDWCVKRMIRMIVLSATYRQSSVDRPDLESVDPTNRLLARQRRIRVDAEIVRDITLSVSGLLDKKIGGPSVFPYQPPGVMDLPQVKREWVISEGGDRYRRGLYTYFWRSSPHPMLKLLDAPEALTACTRRNRSNTPLQALLLLNDEAFVECARKLAANLHEQPGSDEDRIVHAVRSCLGRSPSPTERTILNQLLQEQRQHFSRSVEAARQACAAPAIMTNDEVTEWASWTSVARALLNLDELITRE